MEISKSKNILKKSFLFTFLKWFRIGNFIIIINSYNSYIYAIIGPHWPGVLFTSLLIIICGYLNIYLNYKHKYSLYIIIITYICIILSELFLFITALSDPGIIQLKQYYQSSLSNKKSKNNSNNSNNHNNINNEEEEKEVEEEESASFLEDENSMPYCDVCNISQPRGTAHCSFCNCCIEGLDHHCPWMGKCIGKKNMFWFQCFITVIVLYILQVLVVALIL